MKKLFYAVIIIFLLTLIYSCDAEFDPQMDLDGYAFYCIIRGDSSYQVATLSRVYHVDNYDPMSNTVDPSVKFAKIILTDSSSSGQKVIYQFRDSSIARTNDSRYNSPLNFYYIKNFKLAKPTSLKIEVTLPNGKKLRQSLFAVPPDKYSVKYFLNDNPKYLQGGKLQFDWSNVKNEPNYIKPYFLPEFIIKYSHYESGRWVKYQKKIPLHYSNVNGEDIPIYPEIDAVTKKVIYDTLTIKKTFEMITKNDPNKNNYKFEKSVFMLHLLGNSFATYISLQQNYKSDFSISIIEPDYRTINGGLGIFSYMHTIQLEVPVNSLVNSFYANKY